MSWRGNLPLWHRTDVRLTTWYAAVLLVTLAMACGFLGYRLHHNLMKQVDGLLRDEAHRVQFFLNNERRLDRLDGFFRIERSARRAHRIRFKLFAGDGRPATITRKKGLGGIHLSSAALEKILRGHVLIETRRNRRTKVRVLIKKLRGMPEPLVLQIKMELQGIQYTMENFYRNTLVLIPGALFLCALGGGLLARRALAPIHRIASTAERISAQNLAERLPIQRTGDELDHLSQVINHMLDRLERSFEEMRRFSADMAHELRTPLCAMRGEAELLLTRDRSKKQYREGLVHFMEQFERLTHMTNDLLFLARSEAQPNVVFDENVQIEEVLEHLGEFFDVLAQERGIHFEIQRENGALVRGNHLYLQQLFSNLLDNAIKYAPDGGEVRIQMERHHPWIRVWVKNTGEGIPAEDLPHLFERFYRVEKSRSRNTGGVGLGLNIARKITELHGGRIQIQSTPGQWTQVVVDLPMA